MNLLKQSSSVVLVLMVSLLQSSPAFALNSTTKAALPQLPDVRFQLRASPPEYVAEKRPPALPNTDSSVKFAKLANEDWYTEEVTCVRKSPDGRMVAVGGYLRRTFLLSGRPKRLFGSKMHVLDAVTHKEVIALEAAPVAERTREEQGGSKILDCMFLSNSRYLAAVTNSKLLLWDTQRGRVLAELYFDQALEVASLEYGHTAGQDYLAVVSGKQKKVYQLVEN
jgi:hypothetical protein